MHVNEPACFYSLFLIEIGAARPLERSNAESTPQSALQKCLLMCMSSIFVVTHSFPHKFQLLDFRELTGISSYQKALHPCCAAPLQNPHYKHQAGKRH